jgi:hypothetical protein
MATRCKGVGDDQKIIPGVLFHHLDDVEVCIFTDMIRSEEEEV